jgi:hypothetical protein
VFGLKGLGFGLRRSRLKAGAREISAAEASLKMVCDVSLFTLWENAKDLTGGVIK